MVPSFPVVPAHWYEIQASADQQSWNTIGQTGMALSNNWVHFGEPETNDFPSRFYRLVLH
jgi:hypothetical protein